MGLTRNGADQEYLIQFTTALACRLQATKGSNGAWTLATPGNKTPVNVVDLESDGNGQFWIVKTDQVRS